MIGGVVALIRRADAHHMARDAVTLDLGRLEQVGEAMVAHAKAQAERIVNEAFDERARLISSASAEGHVSGRAAGFEVGRKEGHEAGRAEGIADASAAIGALIEAWAEALSVFMERRERMLLDARQDVVRLACEIAARATGRIIEIDPSTVCDQMAEILELVSARTRLRVRVCGDDEVLLNEALPGLLARLEKEAHVELIVDPAVHRGSCVAMTERNGVIDASIETKLSRLIGSILPLTDSEP